MSDRAGGPVLAEVFDYDDLVVALRERAQERRIVLSSEQNNAVAGLPDKYLGKVLGRVSTIKRRLGLVSLGPVLGVLGCKLLLVENAEALRIYGPRLEYGSHFLGATSKYSVSPTELSRRLALGRKNRWAKAPSASRLAHSKKMNISRWSKVTPEARSAHGKKMISARWRKREP